MPCVTQEFVRQARQPDTDIPMTVAPDPTRDGWEIATGDRNALWQAHNREWAVWACETISAALDQYGQNGSFFDVLNFFAQKRNSLARTFHTHEAELYGVWRDENLDPSHRTRTTFFGPSRPPYDKAVAAYSHLHGDGVDASSVLRGSVRGRIGAETYELTSFKCDLSGRDPHSRVWLHTHWRNVRPIMNHCRELFEMVLEPIEEQQAMDLSVELHWWFVHALPFARGSTSIGEWLLGYIWRMRGYGGLRFQDDPAAVALVSPSPALYREAFRANVALVPSEETPPPIPSERRLANAARLGKTGLVKKLLRGLPADVAEPTGYTALHLAAREGRLGVVKALLKRGAPVQAKVVDSWESPLHLAARQGHWRVARTLLRHGAQVDARDADGMTALHHAARQRRVWVARLLLSWGANPALKDALQRLPLHYAAEMGEHRLVSRLMQNMSVEEISAVDNRAETPLSLAALRGHATFVKALLKRGARGPQQDPQLFAIRMGHLDVERSILASGIDLSLYRLLSRTAARGHGAAFLLMRERLLRPLDKHNRMTVEALLPTLDRGVSDPN